MVNTARVSGLLDRAVETLEDTRGASEEDGMAILDAISRVREAQSIILGEPPVRPEQN